MSKASWDKVQIFGYVDDRKGVQFKAAPPKSWWQKKWEEIMPWFFYFLGLFSGIALGMSWD